MSLRVGDAAFTRDGYPSIVKERDGLTKQLKVEKDPKAVSKAMRHGYINGLSQEQRTELYKILDDAKTEENVADRIGDIKERLGEIEKDPQNFMLAKYLRAEMLHIMNSHGIKPTEYTVDESKVR